MKNLKRTQDGIEVKQANNLLVGHFYYVESEMMVGIRDMQVMTIQMKFKGITGSNGSMLMFERPTNCGTCLSVCFQTIDCIQDRIKIMTEAEYKKEKTLKLWEKINERAKE